VRFIGTGERGEARNATITPFVPIAFGLHHSIGAFVNEGDEAWKELEGE
jgi:hypothetical protein